MKPQSLRVGSLVLDLERLCVDGGAGAVPLRPKSFEVLRHLMERAGRVVPKEHLIDAVWPGVTASDESLAQCISDVRRAIGDETKEIIRTIPKRGYVIDGPLTVKGLVSAEASSDADGGATSEGTHGEQKLNGGELGQLPKGQTLWQTATFRSFALAGLAAAVVMAPHWRPEASAPPSSVSSRDGLWQGALRCDQLPFTAGPLITHFAVKVSGTTASYSRRVLSPDLHEKIMGVEEGGGTIDPSGAIKLTGGWDLEPHIRLAASYTGMLAAHTAEVNGTQVFNVDGQESTRNCTIRLTR